MKVHGDSMNDPLMCFTLIPVIIGLVIYITIEICIDIYIHRYYESEIFQNLKNKMRQYVNECNELNMHIEDLKSKHVPNAECKNNIVHNVLNIGIWQYSRPKLFDRNHNHNTNANVHECSLSLLKGAREQPFKYICKYFNISIDENTLNQYEDMLNDYSAIEQGTSILQNERKELIDKCGSEIPKIIICRDKTRLMKKLGFEDITIIENYVPSYVFRYTSAGGNSGQACIINMDIETLSQFISFLSNKIQLNKSAKEQRQLMTPQLREQIKKSYES